VGISISAVPCGAVRASRNAWRRSNSIVDQSSTRHEELLFDRSDLQQAWKLRRVLHALEGAAGLELLIDKLRSTKSNKEFLNEIAKAPVMGA